MAAVSLHLDEPPISRVVRSGNPFRLIPGEADAEPTPALPADPVAVGRAADPASLIGSVPRELLSDEDLVTAYVRGDQAAFAVVWKRHSRLVRDVVRRTLGPDASGEDLLQEAFLVFLRRAGEIVEPRALRGYLISVAIRLALSERRRRRVRDRVQLTITGRLPDAPMAPADFANIEAARALQRILDKLSTRRRLAFVLRCVEKLTVQQTAAALGVSRATAKREIQRARTIVVSASLSDPALREYSERALRRPRRKAHCPRAAAAAAAAPQHA